jgi:putative restriction endonuclease
VAKNHRSKEIHVRRLFRPSGATSTASQVGILKKTESNSNDDVDFGEYRLQRSISNDEREQCELTEVYKTKPKKEIRDELQRLNPIEPEQIIIKGRTYKRDNKTIAQLKILGDFKCQICNTSIVKKDGTRLVEAAHIDAKCQKGAETPDNILLLCPNHHSEFDFGDLHINARDKNQLEFTLNGRRHKLKFLV